MIYDLPECVEVCEKQYKIRSDYRAVLDICTALSDFELNDQEKAAICLDIFYPDFQSMPQEHYEEAIEKCFWFINGGNLEKNSKRQPKLVDWEKDFPILVGPVNRVLGKEIREEPLHWWTFLSAYMEIGDCLFSQVVNIRLKKAKGKQLDKADKEFYTRNRDLIDIKTDYTNTEKSVLSAWGVK